MWIDVLRKERPVCLEAVLLELPSSSIAVQDQNVFSTEIHFNVPQTGKSYIFSKFPHKIFSVFLHNNIHESIKCHEKSTLARSFYKTNFGKC